MNEWLAFGLSFLGGIRFLCHWQVWLAAVAAVFFNCLTIMATTKIEFAEGLSFFKKMLAQMLLPALANSFLLAVLLGFLLPIMVGSAEAAPISVVIAFLPNLFLIAMIAGVIVTGMCMIPLVGGFIAASPAIQIFIEGSLIFKFIGVTQVKELIQEKHLNMSPEAFFAGFWIWVLYCVFSLIAQLLVIFGITLLQLLWERLAKSKLSETAVMYVCGSSGVLAGLYTLSMYAFYTQFAIYSALHK